MLKIILATQFARPVLRAEGQLPEVTAAPVKSIRFTLALLLELR